jgi:hypothetical protein
MILFKIDPQHLTLLPLKCNTPWAVDVDTVTFRYSLKAVKIEKEKSLFNYGPRIR